MGLTIRRNSRKTRSTIRSKSHGGENRFETGVTVDIYGNPVLNSAGDAFDPPIQIDDSRPTLKIVRNERTYNAQYAMLWKDTINADMFFYFPPHSVKLSTPLAELEYNPVCGFYYVVTYQFEINPKGWEKPVLDQGMRQLVAGVKVKMTDDSGADLSSPLPLDGAGSKLVSGSDPTYIIFEVYREADFSLLGLNPFSGIGQGF